MESLGQYLRQERQLRQISLEEISLTTRIPRMTLEQMERGEFESLPGEVFARGFLKSYAKSVGIPVEEVLSRYRTRGRQATDRRSTAGSQGDGDDSPAPITAVTAPERGGRFGVAIALVVLLILFTLALSIVLRPREGDTPIELSSLPTTNQNAAV